jgi:hypothetical protein
MSPSRPNDLSAGAALTPQREAQREGGAESAREDGAGEPRARRPYEPPAFIISRAFERQALSCAGCLNQSASFPAFCAMRS